MSTQYTRQVILQMGRALAQELEKEDFSGIDIQRMAYDIYVMSTRLSGVQPPPRHVVPVEALRNGPREIFSPSNGFMNFVRSFVEYGDMEDQAVSLPLDVMTSLRTRVFEEGDDSAAEEDAFNTTALHCAICMDRVKDGESLTTTKCNHDFHTACISRHFANSCRCPICRRDQRE